MASTATARQIKSNSTNTLPKHRLFTVDEYYRMTKAGIFYEDDRVELIEGEFIEMAAIGSRHFVCVNRFNMWFAPRLAGRAIVSVQNPVLLSSYSMPEPDLVLFGPEVDEYGGPVPGPEDVLLLIEVSDTTLRYDRGRKLPLYARTGIPEVWIVDLRLQCVYVYRRPEGGSYGEFTTVTRDGLLSPLAFPDLILPVAEILGAR